MGQSKIISKKIFWVIFIIGLIVSGIISYGAYLLLELQVLMPTASGKIELTSSAVLTVLNLVAEDPSFFFKMILPCIIGACLLLAVIFWGILRVALARQLNASDMDHAQESSPAVNKKKDFVDQKIEQEKRQRLFLHTLSVLQREGRLMDFFNEDLALYSDEQIGAAVRSIQEDCKKAVKKYINPQPVIKEEEGQTVTIDKGFDIDSIKLIGNVSGEPPFKGIVKHPGWKAGRKDLPKLTQVQDSTVMAPAEIEIQ